MARPASLAIALALLSATSIAHARCARVSLPEEVQRSDYIVEAVLIEAGETATFRTILIYKGGPSAPSRFALGSRQGRGQWPWRDSSNVGQRYFLFLQRSGSQFSVARCGSSGPASDALRRALEAEGLRPEPPPHMPH